MATPELRHPLAHRYNRDAVDAEIRKDRRIKGREAKLIHALLKGRQRGDA